MEQFTTLGFTFLLGIVGAILASLFMIKDKVKRNEFSCKKFVRENKSYWGWIVITLSIITFLLAYVPEAATAVELITGIAVKHSKMAYVTLGAALAGGTNGFLVSKKISDKNEVEVNKTLGK